MITLKYQIMREYNYGTEEEPNIVQTINEKEVLCNVDTYEAAYATAKAEAYNGEVTVEEVPDPETPEAPDTDSVWEELDKAYQEGVDSV